MPKILPRDLENEVYDFIELVKAKGAAGNVAALDNLVKSLQYNSPAIDIYVKKIIAQELLPSGNLTSREYQVTIKLVEKLEKWRGPRLLRRKVAHTKVKLCVSLTETDSMNFIRSHTKEGPSFVVRRLLREEAARIVECADKPGFSN